MSGRWRERRPGSRPEGRSASALAAASVAVVVIVVSLAAQRGTAPALPKIPAERFAPPEDCGCHAGLLEQWKRSMHAKALVDPIYRLKLAEANKATDGALGPLCDSCHAPVAVMGGLETSRPRDLPPQAGEGVTCAFCHQVSGTRRPPGNVSQTIRPDGTYRAQFHDALSPQHATAYSAFHESAEFCGACHNVDHPLVKGLHLEATYTEWANGPYAAEGVTCQDCHMTPGPGVTKPYPGKAAGGGPQREHIYLMTFAGGNVGLGDSVAAETRLKSAATVALETPEVVGAGQEATVSVTVTNVGAGHYLPTGLTEVRQMWLETTVTDERGHAIVIGRHDFGRVLKDADGHFPVELWDAVAFERDYRIPPKGSVTDAFTFTMPAGQSAELSARLYYRSCPEDMAEEAGADIPTTTMAAASVTVWSSDDARSAAGRRSEDGASDMTTVLGVAAAVSIAGVAVALLIARSRRRRGRGDPLA